ncbi:MAG: hypothetical protein R3D80_20535 [Paracoccaceae bacterium]
MLGVLAAFKWPRFLHAQPDAAAFEGHAVRARPHRMVLILPVGISFYTFQAISYVMDVDRGHVAARRNPADVFLYILLPQLVAGPIVRAARYSRLPQIDAGAARRAAAQAAAVVLILSGLFKKMVVANYLSVLLVDPVGFPDGQNFRPQRSPHARLRGADLLRFLRLFRHCHRCRAAARLRFYRNFDPPYAPLPCAVLATGTSRCRPGSATTSTSRSAATGAGRCAAT